MKEAQTSGGIRSDVLRMLFPFLCLEVCSSSKGPILMMTFFRGNKKPLLLQDPHLHTGCLSQFELPDPNTTTTGNYFWLSSRLQVLDQGANRVSYLKSVSLGTDSCLLSVLKWSFHTAVGREREEARSLVSVLIRTLIPSRAFHPHDLIPPEGHILKYNQKLRVRISVYEFEGGGCNSVYSTEFSRQISPDCWMKVVSSLWWDWKKPVTAAGVRVLVTQLCLTLCDPVDCSLPGSSVQGVLQARILEWVVGPFSRGSSRLGD